MDLTFLFVVLATLYVVFLLITLRSRNLLLQIVRIVVPLALATYGQQNGNSASAISFLISAVAFTVIFAFNLRTQPNK